MAFLPAAPPAHRPALAHCAAVFLPSDPPRAGRVAFWHPDGEPFGEADVEAGALDPDDMARVRDLAAAMPPYAPATPLPDTDPLALPEPEQHLRAFLDAVADGLPRSPAAALVTGGPAFAAGQDAGVRISLRVEIHGADGAEWGAKGDGAGRPEGAAFRAVLQLHDLTDPTLVADAAEVWAGASSAGQAFGPRARMDTLLTLRRAAGVWPPLAPLLSAAVPDALPLADEEIAELLGAGGLALSAAGVPVHWPKELVRTLTGRAVVGAQLSR